MAQRHDSKIITPVKGMYLDGPRNSQPEGTYSFALNGVDMSEEGEPGFLGNELGNSLNFSLKDSYYQIGNISIINNEAIIFSVSEDETRSEIGKLDQYGNYITIINSTTLGFALSQQIQGVITAIGGCDTIIEFISPKPYYINIDSLDQYLLDGFTQDTANADGLGWDVTTMKLFPDFDRAIIDDIKVNNSGGSLPLGTYNIIFTYVDGGLNNIGWMDMSLSIPIVDENYLGSNFNDVDGGVNSIIPPTTKSIVVNLSNIDQSFPYIRAGVVASNDGVKTAYVLPVIEIGSSEMEITISSITDVDISSVPVTSLTVERTVYESAKSITQKDNRLILGGVNEKNILFSKFQQKANEIKSHWFNKSISSELENNVKTPEYYLDYKSYMSDEVYSLGIEWYFTDGYVTPPFHIPGRKINKGYLDNNLPLNIEPNPYHSRLDPISGWDNTLYVVGTDIDLSEVRHLGLSIGDSVERWKVYNTSIKFTTVTDSEFNSEGELSYFESSLSYPDSVDCDGNRVYPEGNIRYHKMPDVSLIPHAAYNSSNNTYNIYPIGLSFSNIEAPSEYLDQIVGYKIVRVKRTNSNTSIVDKGLFTRTLEDFKTFSGDLDDEELVNFQPFPYNSNRVYWDVDMSNRTNPYLQGFHGAISKFQKKALGATHLKFDQKLVSVPFPAGEEIDYITTDFPEARSQSRFSVGNESYLHSLNFTNKSVLKQAYIDPDTLLSGFFDHTFDNTEQQEVLQFQTEDPVLDPASEANMVGEDEDSPVYFYYGGVKKYLPSQYGTVNSSIYIPVSNSIRLYSGISNTNEYGGDTFISRLYFRRQSAIKTGSTVAPTNEPADADYLERHLVSFFVESTINVSLRHEGTTVDEVYYPKSYEETVDAFLDLETTTALDAEKDLIPNWYAYNDDFSKENDVKINISLEVNHDWCNDCSNEFPRRIAYSERKSEDASNEAHKIFLSNNYSDLNSNKGIITNIFLENDKLYAHTEGSLYFIPTDEQTLNTNDSTITIGNSSFMSLGAVEIKTIREGYLGSNSQWATINTEFGTVFHSHDKMFVISENLTEISDIGMRKFFNDNKLLLPITFYNTLGIEFPNKDNTANPNGIGYIASFDRTKNRYIITKKDFLPIVDFKLYSGVSGNFSLGDLIWNEEEEKFQTILTGISDGSNILPTSFLDIEFTNSDYFENKSFTLSFDLKNKQWVSFHSYIPNYMFNTYNNWYTSLTNDIYKHNSGEYQKFYGIVYPHIIETVVTENIINSQTSKSLAYVSQAKTFDSTYKQWQDDPFKTFNRVWLYNDDQSTGLLDTIVTNNNSNPFISINYSPTSIMLYKADKTWRFTAKRSYVANGNTLPISTSRWSDIKDNYYIDKLPLSLSLDTAQSQFNLKKFRDKYLVIRLILDTPDNSKIITQYEISNHKYSVR